MNKTTFGFSVLVLLLILLGGIVWAAGTPTIDRWAMVNSGGHDEESSYSLDSLTGMAIVGVDTQGAYELCAGWWCSPAAAGDVYLPLLLRNQ